MKLRQMLFHYAKNGFGFCVFLALLAGAGVAYEYHSGDVGRALGWSILLTLYLIMAFRFSQMKDLRKSIESVSKR